MLEISLEELLADKTSKFRWSKGRGRAAVPNLTSFCVSIPLYLISLRIKNADVWDFQKLNPRILSYSLISKPEMLFQSIVSSISKWQ